MQNHERWKRGVVIETWMVEVAKAAPWGVVIVLLVYWFFQDKAREAQKSEERLKTIITEQTATNKLMQETLAANNTALGGITVFMSILEREAKDAKRNRT